MTRTDVVERYVDGFRAGDHAAILACLTDDVTWDIVGHATASGREQFDALIDGPTVPGCRDSPSSGTSKRATWS